MNIVDNDLNTTKYTDNNNKRHVSSINNITYWLKLNVDYINEENKQIINKYKKILNQKNIDTIIKCIKYSINIVPIIYQFNHNNIHLLISKALRCMNIYIIKLINKHARINCDIINKQLLMHYLINYIKFTKFLHEKKILTKQDIQLYDNFACKWICEKGYVDTVKYFHKNIGLEKVDFQSNNNISCVNACEKGHVHVIKYLHQRIGLTKQDFQSRNNYAYQYACRYGYIDVVKYLHQHIGLTKNDLQNINICSIACIYGHIDVIKYLHRDFGMTKEDFQSDNNDACFNTCMYGHIDVVKYLHKVIGLTKEDFQSDDNIMYKFAFKFERTKVVKYLLREVKIKVSYYCQLMCFSDYIFGLLKS